MLTLELFPATSPRAAVRYEPMLLVVMALALGIWGDRNFSLSLVVWWVIASLSLAAWCFDFRIRHKSASSCWLLLAIAALGAAWHHWQWSLLPSDHLAVQVREEPQPVCLEAIVVRAPRLIPAPPPTPLRPFPLGDRTKCELDLLRVRRGANWEPCVGRTSLLVDGHLPHILSGHTVRVFASYRSPTPQLNPGEFDYASFARADGVYVHLTCEMPEAVIRLPVVRQWMGSSWLDEVRRGGRQLLQRHISSERAPLAAAIMLGERDHLDTERNERFLVTGTVHLLAISGVNLAILVYAFWIPGHLGWLSRRGTLLAAVMFSLAYALLTDAEPPVLRAAILVTVFCTARWRGRRVSPWQSLATAAVVVLLLNPADLFHLGAQLSFLAVGTLVWFREWFTWRESSDPLDRLIERSRSWSEKLIRGTAWTAWQITLSGFLVWLYSLPLVWLHYNLISPVGVGLNPLLVLPMALALFSGFALLVLGGLVPLAGDVAGAVCDASLLVMEQLIWLSEPLPGGFHWLPAPPAWLVAVFYVQVLIAMWLWQFSLARRWFLAAGAVWLTIAWYEALPPDLPRRELVASFVSVGHGTAVLVELPQGGAILYDCGRMGSPLSGARPIAAVLWSRGITRLDAVVISHADSDHYNALPELLERFAVREVYVSSVMWKKSSSGLKLLRAAIDQRHIPITELRAGDRLRTSDEDLSISVLHPPRGGVLGSDNANSIVLLMEYDSRRLLLTGDLEERGLYDLLAEEPVPCDVVLAPHHGSTRSDPHGFSLWCQPKYVVISGNREFDPRGNHLALQHAYATRGAQVFHTASDGMIRFGIGRTGVEVHPFRQPPEGN